MDQKPYAHLFSYMHKIEDQGKMCVVNMYCLRPEGGTAIVTVKEFRPYLFLEVPEEYTILRNKKQKLSDYLNQTRDFKTCMCSGYCGCPREKHVLKWSWVYRKRLYFAHKEKTDTGYINKKALFIKIDFQSLRLLDVFKNQCRQAIKLEGYPPFRVKVHKSDQMLLKFFASTHLPSVGWVDIHVPKIEDEHKITMVELNIDEYVCSYKSITPSADDSVLHPKIMTFDIEAYSHVHTAMPNVWDS